MGSLISTVLVAFLIFGAGIALLAIGWLITGRSRLQPGACGRDPTKKRDDKEGCGTGVRCDLCEKPGEKK